MSDNNSYRHILKYTGVFGSVQGLNVLISLVRNKFVAVLLGPGGMGLVSLLNTALSFISQLTNLGIAMSAVRNLAELYEKGDEAALSHYIKVVRMWCLVAALFGVLLCCLAAPLLDLMSFSWGNHTLHFFLLAPAVGMAAITGGEAAILKATQRLRPLAVIQIWNMVVSLVVTVPLYYYYGETAIVPVMTLMGLAAMLLTLGYSYRFYPLRLKGDTSMLAEGLPMVKLGVAFILAGVVGSASEMIIRSFLNVQGSLDDVGFYNAAYMMTVTYAAMVFSAIDSDFYPRLSAVNHDVKQSNEVVNRQLEMSLLIVAPMLVAFIIGLPILIPLLFSKEFEPIIGLTQLSATAMYLKVLTLPVAYITLARGRSKTYLGLEIAYFVFFVLATIACYLQWGLYGMGVALVSAHVFDFLVIHVVARLSYDYRISRQVIRYSLVQVGLGVLTFGVTFIKEPLTYWVSGTLLLLLSSWFSLRLIRQKTRRG